MRTTISQNSTTTSTTTSWVRNSLAGVAIVVTLLLSGCDPIGNIGVTPLTPVETLFTDTLTVRTSTVLADSVRTGNPDYYLAGRYVDPIFGTITASSFIRMSLFAQLDLGTSPVYDSLVLVTNYSYSYGDTLPPQTLAVHRIREVIDPTRSYYNNSTVAYDPTPLAKRTFNATPRSNGVLRFRLPDDLGKELFALSGQTGGQTNAEFAKTLGGFALIPDAKNTAVLGFQAINNALAMRLYYHTTTDTTTTSFVALAIAVSQTTGQPIFRAGFNRVTADRSGTPLAGLQPLVPRPAGDGPTYVQDALGIRTKIEIPYLKSLGGGKPIAINRAELTVKPDLSAIQQGLGIPNYLVLLETDATNRTYYDESNNIRLVFNDLKLSGTEPPAVLYNSRFNQYTWHITTQLNNIISGVKKYDSFLVSPSYTDALGQSSTRYQSQLNNRVTRLVIGSKPEDVKLVVFYTEAKE
ncbi:DUF4270 family protein [Persicitalea jodogahamensis]|uniref:DUF4270 family protein n=1 Tax=Persicitalea jodogahamensis TaxID=402147 RepID=UPI001E3A7DBE|nr:DUF4270 family protein [Persicitalea jodogahamensis]